MEDLKTLLTNFRVAYAYEHVVLQFLPNLQPAFILVGVGELRWVSSADVHDVHVIFVQGLKLLLKHEVNYCVCQLDFVKIGNISP